MSNKDSFNDLNVDPILVEACTAMGWNEPTKIQMEVIPQALEGKNIVALAETGSGKTGAFAIPIIQSLLGSPQRLFALVLTPTRELAFQIAEQFEALGSSIGLKTAVIVGGIDNASQAISLSKRPHVIVATPGRLVDHLENTKGFNLKSIRFLVLDEADRILNMDFEEEVDKILCVSPSDRKTFLFSATMTSKVQKLQRASMKDPVRIEVSKKYGTVMSLQQYYMFVPQIHKLTYLVALITELTGNVFMIFCSTCIGVQKVTIMLNHLNFNAVGLHGQLDQQRRLVALKKFKNQKCSILVATDVASRGLDIPQIDIVINLDVPVQSKEYIHRVGRTARAGRAGRAITLVSQFDLEFYLRIEKLINKKLTEYNIPEEAAMVFLDNVNEAERYAKMELRESKGEHELLKIDEEDAEIPGMMIKLPKNRKIHKNKGRKRRT